LQDELLKNVTAVYPGGGVLTKSQKSVIDNILRELRNGQRNCDIASEIEEVLSAD
jgi:hypothetical protein